MERENGEIMIHKKFIMKELPLSEQPYEKGIKYGVKVLSDAELLAVVLRSGSKNERVVELATKVLQCNNTQSGINILHSLNMHELMKIPGIGKVKALQLLAVAEISNRMVRLRNEDGIRMTDPESVARCYMEEMRHLKREECRLILFDTKSKLIGEQVLSIGTVNTSILSPREVFITALSHDAVHIILLHNHPSGDPTPSKEDKMITNRIAEAGNLVGIRLMDHIIIGDNKYVSLKEIGFIL